MKDGHKTPDPEWSTYAGFVTRDSVRIALTYAALNDLDIFAADIQNAYLQAPASEKHYFSARFYFTTSGFNAYANTVNPSVHAIFLAR